MSIKSKFLNMSFLSLALLPLPVVAMASDVGTPDVEVLKGLYLGKTAFDLITNFSQMTIPEELVEQYSPGSSFFFSVSS